MHRFTPHHYFRVGFTLVELMIVIAIIGILAAALFPSMNAYIDRSVFATQQKHMIDMKTAIETYFNDMGNYPTSSGGQWRDPYGCYGSYGPIPQNEIIPQIVARGYIPMIPMAQKKDQDCTSGGNFYIYSSNGTDYKLLTHGLRAADYMVRIHPELIDPYRDGGVNILILETGATLKPWAWGYWTPGAGW